MRISGSILLLLVAIVVAESGSNPVCEVCGAGKVVSVPDEVVTVPGQPTINCANLQANGLSGIIEQRFCGLIPTLIDPTCVCVDAAPSVPTTSEVSPPTQVPTPLAPDTAPVSTNVTIATVAPISASPVSPAPIAPQSDAPMTTGSTDPAPVSVDLTNAPVTTAPASTAPVVEASDSPLEPPVEPPAVAPAEGGGSAPTNIVGPVTEPSRDKGTKGGPKEPDMKDSKEMQDKKEKHARGDEDEEESTSGKNETTAKEESPDDEKRLEDTPEEVQPVEEKPDETHPEEGEPKEGKPEEEVSHDEVPAGDEPTVGKGTHKGSDRGNDSTGDDDDGGKVGAKKDSPARHNLRKL